MSLVSRNTPGTTRDRAGFSLLELMLTVTIILVLLLLLLGRGMFSNRQKQVTRCQKNLQTIYLALKIYAGDNQGQFPVVPGADTAEKPLSLLVPRSTAVTEIFICPASDEKMLPEGESFADRRISYAYYMGHTQESPPEALLLTDRQVNTLPKIARQKMFSEEEDGPASNHGDAGGNLLRCDGSIRFAQPRANRDYLIPTNIVLLNPKP